MKVYAFESVDWAEVAEHGLTPEKTVAAIERGLAATNKLLPTLSEYLNIVVRPNSRGIIPEYGTGGYTSDSEFIEIWLDKIVPHGTEKILESLYQTVFHEGNHAARYNVIEFDGRFLNYVVTEGLATVFEREHAGYQPLYGQYEDDVTMRKWFAELQKADWNKRDELFFSNPDGRRWVGYKTGTWLVDKAVKNSGKTVVDLTSLPCDQIIKYAKVGG